ncbi:MAG: UDP-glucose/GDP-mannose dehydrogenase family protein [Hyphomicrobiales bacterium]|nr:UDP-glucose/GDP-mannose dehydrogenase family protein [Hyphomicrobiales bacterium]
MRVVMIGTGYVGLVSGACFADFGHDVICIDKDEKKIENLKNGVMPIFEPGLEGLVESNVKAGRLNFDSDPNEAVGKADVVFIAVGTPTRRGDGHADLRYVYQAAEELALMIKGYTVIVNKSTVPVGTGDEVEAIIRKTSPDASFDVASNPEFLREGAAINDFKRPDRIVLGSDSERAIEQMRVLYRPLYLNETPMVITSRKTAELTKYAANAFLAVKISFINEIADLCEEVGANVQEISRGIGLDNRIGPKFLNAGPGYGGSCFPKDTLALSRTAEDFGSPLSIVNAVIKSNDDRKKSMAKRIVDACGGDINGKTISILGLTFKPNTDDMRYSASIDIIPELQKMGAEIKVFDPEGMEEAQREFENIEYCSDAYDCLENSFAGVILTEWNQFRALDLRRVSQLISGKILIDLRNIYSRDEVSSEGLEYYSIGRPNG